MKKRITLRLTCLNDDIVKALNNRVDKYDNVEVVLVFENTKFINYDSLKQLDSKYLIRVNGPYDSEKITHARYYKMPEAVTYTKVELLKILEAISEIEKGIDLKWSQLHKLIYFCDVLKSSISYDPKYKRKDSSETRSLRGLLSKNTVCAGFALILKELCDRNNIVCSYVGGSSGAGHNHAWNLVTIDEKIYGIDLTFDAHDYRNGYFSNDDNLGVDAETFAMYHKPASWEPIQDYSCLSSINRNTLTKIRHSINSDRSFELVKYMGKRKDGSEYLVNQIDSFKINDVEFYRYFYQDYKNGKPDGISVMFVGNFNLAKFINDKKFGKLKDNGIEKVMNNKFFSIERLVKALKNSSCYIGGIAPSGRGFLFGKKYDTFCYQNLNSYFSYNQFSQYSFIRKDGSRVVICQFDDFPSKIANEYVFTFDIFELIDGKLLHNVYYGDHGLGTYSFNKNKDVLLSRKTIDYFARERGGYIGSLSEDGLKLKDNLVDYFKSDKDDENDRSLYGSLDSEFYKDTKDVLEKIKSFKKCLEQDDDTFYFFYSASINKYSDKWIKNVRKKDYSSADKMTRLRYFMYLLVYMTKTSSFEYYNQVLNDVNNELSNSKIVVKK